MATKSKGPWSPVPYEAIDAAAIQALLIGEATAEQQKHAIKWIVEAACGTYDQSFYPGADEGRRNTDFAEGRRFVGNTIVKMTRVNVSSLRRKEE
jgi:hypothetical protein